MISRAASPPVIWPFCPTVSLCSPTEIDPSTLPSTSRSSLPEICPFTLIVGLSHEACAVVPVGLPLLTGTLGAFEGTTRPEDAPGADCDSLFRHIVPPSFRLKKRRACHCTAFSVQLVL